MSKGESMIMAPHSRSRQLSRVVRHFPMVGGAAL
jgi:hypothetical protein